MPSIRPFKGLRYDPNRVGSLARVVTPPYDVISPGERYAYYRAHPFNFIRVVYGKSADPYSEAKANLTRWIRSGVLKRDEEPSVYPYEQAYRLKGKFHRRLGVIALVRLDSKVYPHEHTFGGPKKDRLRLMKRVNASLDPIFGLVPDAAGRYRRVLEGAIRGRKPAASFMFQGVRHRLWRISDLAWIRKLQQAVRSKDLVIADGHHRFEAARAYRQERRRKDPGVHPSAPYDFVMFYLSAAGAEDPGLLPTHRVVRVPPGRLKRKLEQARKAGFAEPVGTRKALVDRLQELRAKTRVGIGLYSGNGAGYLLESKGGSAADQLDVEWLHRTVLPKWLGGRGLRVTTMRDLDQACAEVRSGRAQAVFVMQVPRLKDVLARARSLRRMPRKTTYFYPKLPSGLVEYPFETLKGSDPFRVKRV